MSQDFNLTHESTTFTRAHTVRASNEKRCTATGTFALQTPSDTFIARLARGRALQKGCLGVRHGTYPTPHPVREHAPFGCAVRMLWVEH